MFLKFLKRVLFCVCGAAAKVCKYIIIIVILRCLFPYICVRTLFGSKCALTVLLAVSYVSDKSEWFKNVNFVFHGVFWRKMRFLEAFPSAFCVFLLKCVFIFLKIFILLIFWCKFMSDWLKLDKVQKSQKMMKKWQKWRKWPKMDVF